MIEQEVRDLVLLPLVAAVLLNSFGGPLLPAFRKAPLGARLLHVVAG